MRDQNRDEFQSGLHALFLALGEDPKRDGLRDTPRRVFESRLEMCRGYKMDPSEILAKKFEVEFDEMIVLRDISFTSLCEHHLLPFSGAVTIAYVPGDKLNVVGISKLARLVECFACRLQVQERMTKQIAEALETHLECAGCGVLVSAIHSCMSCRGVKQSNAKMVTSVLLGIFRDDPRTRSEFLSLARNHHV